MVLSKGQQVIGWFILIACLLAAPIGLYNKSSQNLEEKPAKHKKRLFNLTSGGDRLLVLRLKGMIYDGDDESPFFPSLEAPSVVRRKIRKAVEDEHVKGILLRINSPGGTVATSQELYDALRAFRSQGKPVVVSMGDVAASGGYYIACAADRIFANPGTLTGSIGVIMHLFNLQEIEKKLGVQSVVIKSGAFKDIGSFDRPMSTEEKALLQGIIMDSYDQFVEAVSLGRKMPVDRIKKLADGRIYSGRQALKVKLVDELGGQQEALACLQNIAKKRYKLSEDLEVEDRFSSGFLGGLLDLENGIKVPSLQGNLLKDVLPLSMDYRFCNEPLWLMQ